MKQGFKTKTNITNGKSLDIATNPVEKLCIDLIFRSGGQIYDIERENLQLGIPTWELGYTWDYVGIPIKL
jgi:hypothetical protein